MADKSDYRIDADDQARLDAHAEHAAFEYSLEPADKASQEYDLWLESVGFGNTLHDIHCKMVVIQTGRYELRLFLDTEGSTSLQIHRMIDEDANGDLCEPHIPDSDPAILTRPYKPRSYICLCLGEPVMQLGTEAMGSMVDALAKASRIAARYESEWKRHYEAFRAGPPKEDNSSRQRKSKRTKKGGAA